MQICTVNQLQGREGKISTLQIKHVRLNTERLRSEQCVEVSELTWHHFTCKPPVSLPKGRVMRVTSVLTGDQQKQSVGQTKTYLCTQWHKYRFIKSAWCPMTKPKKQIRLFQKSCFNICHATSVDNTFELWEYQSRVYRSYLLKWFCAITHSVIRSETFRRKQLPVIVETGRAVSVTCKTQSNSKPVVFSQPGDRVKLCTDGLCLLKAKTVRRFESVTTSILKMERFDLWLWLFNSPALYWWFKWVTELQENYFTSLFTNTCLCCHIKIVMIVIFESLFERFLMCFPLLSRHFQLF